MAVVWNGTARGTSGNKLTKKLKSSFWLGRVQYVDRYMEGEAVPQDYGRTTNFCRLLIVNSCIARNF